MNKDEIDLQDYFKGSDIDFTEATNDDLMNLFNIYISEVTQNEIVKAQDAIGLEEEYQNWNKQKGKGE